MSHSGGHRVRSVARWVATPVLLVAAAFVGYANVAGSTGLLRISSVVALAASIGAVVLFDTQLVRARRAHGEERSALARSYAATYAAHIRVTDPGSPADWTPVSDRPPKAWPAAASAPTVSVSSGSTPAPRTVAAQSVPTPAPATAATAATAPAAEQRSDARPSDAQPAVFASSSYAASTDVTSTDVTSTGTRDSSAGNSDMWGAIEDAPTVVDMIAWEERARVGIVDADERAQDQNVSDPSAEATQGSEPASALWAPEHPAQPRDTPGREVDEPARTQPASTTWEGEVPTDDPRRHAYGPRDARSA